MTAFSIPIQAPGITWRLLRRTVTGGLAAVTASLVLLPGLAAAATPAQVRSLTSADQAKQLFDISDGAIKDYQIKPNPLPKDPGSVAAKNITVTVAGIPFRMTEMKFLDAGGGQNSWDYRFSPYDGKQVINSQLKFIYRVTNDSSNFGGLVWGDPGDGVELDNLVAFLLDFPHTDLAEKVLNEHATDDGLKWAEESGVPTSESESSFLDRTGDDPFQLAVAKIAEIINSLNQAVVGALLWAVDQGAVSPGIKEAWKVIRDLINLLFVLVLVAIALLTIVRIEPQKYSARSLLPMLVFAVITVNLSLLLATFTLNSATVLGNPFIHQAQQVIEFGGQQVASTDTATGFGDAVVLLIAAFIMLLALIALLFFFIIRIIVIWLLIAASPVLFLFMVLPLTRGEASKLLTQWIRWVYMAPISFMLLYIGSVAAFPAPGQDSTANALLSAIFYAGLIFAAVLIPIGLGGKLMAMLGKQGLRAGKLGGKGGLGLAGSIPLGKGMSVGELARTGKAAMKLRSDAQEARAGERAASRMTELHEALGGGGLATSLMGFDAGQGQPIRNDLVDRKLKQAMLGGMNEANFSRMVAYSMGKRSDLSAPERATVAELNRTWGQASQEEMRMADNPVGELAAVKGLAQTGFMGWGMMPQYAKYGYQEAMGAYDPLMASVRKNYRGGAIGAEHLDMTRVGVAIGSPGGDDVKKYVPDFWESVRPTSEFGRMAAPSGMSEFRRTVREKANTASLSSIMDPTNRVAASDPRRKALAGISRDGFLEPEVQEVIKRADRKREARRAGFRRVT